MYIPIIASAVPEVPREWYEALVGINPFTLVATLVNTLLIFLMYRHFLHKKVCLILEKRKTAINAEMEEAAAAKDKALAAEKEYLQKLSESKDEAQKIVADAVSKAQAKEEQIISEAEKSAQIIRAKADEAIEMEKKRAINEIKNQISELVIMAAKAVTEKEIKEADNKALIENFLVKIGKE